MGIFDQFLGGGEPNMGLLAAAAQLLQASGPSTTRTNMGQALGGALGAYSNASMLQKRQKQQDEEAAQMRQMREMQIRNLTGDVENQELMRKRAAGLQDFKEKYYSWQGQPNPMAAISGPTNANLPLLEQIQRQPQPSPYQAHMALAEEMRKNKFFSEAEAEEEKAFKRQRELKEQKTLMQNGKPVTVNFYKDGSNEIVSGLAPTPKIHWLDQGGSIAPVDEYTMAMFGPAGGFKKSMSPDAAASNALARERLTFDKGQAGKPQFVESIGGFVGRPTAAQPGGSITPLSGYQPRLPEAQQKQVVGVQNLQGAIKEYREALKGFGTMDSLRPDARARMGTKYNNMMLQAKEAYNLGVLNGPDFEILQSVITDPRSFTGAVTSKAALDDQAAELSRMMNQIGATASQRRPSMGGASGDWSIEKVN